MKKNISNDFIITFTGNAFFLLLSISTSIILARLLMPDGRGALASALFWPHFIAGVGVLSINESITYRSSLPNADIKIILSAAIWLSLIMSVLNCMIAYLIMPYLMGNYRSEFLKLAQFYLIIFVPFSFFTINILAIDQGKLNFVRLNFLKLMQPLLYLISIGILWILNMITVNYVAYAALLTTVLTAFYRAVLLKDRTILPLSLSVRKEMKEILWMGIKFHITNLFMFANAEADKLTIIALTDNTSVGIYMVSLSVASTGLGILMQTFITVIFPYISKLNHTAPPIVLIAKSVKYSVLLLSICNAVIAILSPYIIPLLFGKAYASAVDITVILCIAFVFRGVRKVMIYNLRGLGQTNVGSISEAIALCVFSICSGYLFNSLKLPGIGIAMLISDIVALLYLTLHFSKDTRLTIKNCKAF